MNLTSTDYPVKVGRLATVVIRAGVFACCVATGMILVTIAHHLPFL